MAMFSFMFFKEYFDLKFQQNCGDTKTFIPFPK